MNEYEDLVKEFEETKNKLLRELRKKFEEAFSKAVNKFFELNPEFAAIQWVQYTPYFNDGDECIFGVGDIFFIPESGLEEANGDAYLEEVEGVEDTWSLKHKPEVTSLQNIVELSSDILKEVYGDHAFVRLLRTEDGFTVEIDSYDHD